MFFKAPAGVAGRVVGAWRRAHGSSQQTPQFQLFHSSALTSGRKSRYKLRARFFDPRHRWFEQRAIMWRQALTNDQSFIGQISDTFYIPNHPQGDKYLKFEKYYIPGDDIKNEYENKFPEESLYVLERNRPEDFEWYKSPWQRFYGMYEQLTKDGMTHHQAMKVCFDEKQWENEVIEAERLVCAKQAEEMFGFKYNYYEKLQSPDPIEARIDHDPRVAEYEIKLARDKLDDLVRQRMKNPSLPKITLRDTGLPIETVVNYIASNSGLNSRNFLASGLDADLEGTSTQQDPAVSVSDYFDESIYFGSADSFLQHYLGRSREEYEKEAKQKQEEEEEELDEEGEEGKEKGVKPFDFLRTAEYHKMSESQKMQLHLRDLDASMKDWARDLMPMFTDKLDPNDTTDTNEHNKRVVNNTVVNLMRYTQKSALRRALRQNMSSFGIDTDAIYRASSTSTTHIDPHIPKGGMVQGALADELKNIFGRATKKDL